MHAIATVRMGDDTNTLYLLCSIYVTATDSLTLPVTIIYKNLLTAVYC